jgi:hypothetical protein
VPRPGPALGEERVELTTFRGRNASQGCQHDRGAALGGPVFHWPCRPALKPPSLRKSGHNGEGTGFPSECELLHTRRRRCIAFSMSRNPSADVGCEPAPQ